MKIKFKNIEIKNFMSLGEVSLPLDDRGYTFVSGINNNPNDLARSNGSGKSSLFEAIMWCLTGETTRGIKDIVNINANDGAVVTLEFDFDDNQYKLIRSKNDSKLKTNLKIYVNGEDKSGKGIRDSEKLLQEYIPELTSSLIGSVIILGQGLPSRFTNNTPAGRKEILEKLCKSDFMIQDLKDRISRRKDSLSTSLREIEDNILRTTTNIQSSENQLESTKESLANMESINRLEEEELTILASISELQLEIDSLRVNHSSLFDIFNKSSEKYRDLQEKFSSTKDFVTYKYEKELENEREIFSESKLKAESLRNEIERLSKISDVCPTCGQKLANVTLPDTTNLEMSLDKVESDIETVKNKIRRIENERNSEINNLKINFDNDSRQISIEVAKAKDELSNSEKILKEKETLLQTFQMKLSRIKAMIESHNETSQRYTSEIKMLEDKIKELHSNIELLNSSKEEISERMTIESKFSTIATRDFRGYLLDGIISFINKRAKAYCRDIFDTELLEFKLDGNNISISYCNKEYEALSGGEKQKVDLIIQFSIRDMLCTYTNFSTNIIVLDEIFDNLDDVGCSRVINLLSSKLSDISTIFVITHHGGELNIPYDDEIVIVKNESGVSYLK